MLRNTYFDHDVKSEQDLYEDLVIEAISIYGQDIYYLPRTIVNLDTILNEDVESQFNSSYKIVAYIENTEGFEGEGNLLSKFGLEIRDEATFIISRRAWRYYVGDRQGTIRPNEGDLIYLPLSKSIFEVSFVEHEQPFYQLSNLPVFKLQCKLFEYNDEEFNTGVGEIDGISRKSFVLDIELDNVIGVFSIGERITQELPIGVNISAQVVSFDGNTLSVTNIETSDNEYHEFLAGIDIRGNTSSAIGRILVAPSMFGDDKGAQNNDFGFAGSDIIDFSVENPFGEPL